jgi:RNA-directed DNA polymerase
MDDFVFFCNTRGQLRHLIKQVYSVLDELKLTLAASKTYIGRVAKGFNFLGYHISPQQLTVSVSSWQRFKVKWQLLYEQDAQQFVAKALANKVTEM